MNFGALATVTEQSEEIPLRYKRPILIRCALQHPKGRFWVRCKLVDKLKFVKGKERDPT